MTVGELVAELEACDPEQEVLVLDTGIMETFELKKIHIDMDPNAALLAFYNFR